MGTNKPINWRKNELVTANRVFDSKLVGQVIVSLIVLYEQTGANFVIKRYKGGK